MSEELEKKFRGVNFNGSFADLVKSISQSEVSPENKEYLRELETGYSDVVAILNNDSVSPEDKTSAVDDFYNNKLRYGKSREINGLILSYEFANHKKGNSSSLAQRSPDGNLLLLKRLLEFISFEQSGIDLIKKSLDNIETFINLNQTESLTDTNAKIVLMNCENLYFLLESRDMNQGGGTVSSDVMSKFLAQAIDSFLHLPDLDINIFTRILSSFSNNEQIDNEKKQKVIERIAKSPQFGYMIDHRHKEQPLPPWLFSGLEKRRNEFWVRKQQLYREIRGREGRSMNKRDKINIPEELLIPGSYLKIYVLFDAITNGEEPSYFKIWRQKKGFKASYYSGGKQIGVSFNPRISFSGNDIYFSDGEKKKLRVEVGDDRGYDQVFLIRPPVEYEKNRANVEYDGVDMNGFEKVDPKKAKWLLRSAKFDSDRISTEHLEEMGLLPVYKCEKDGVTLYFSDCYSGGKSDHIWRIMYVQVGKKVYGRGIYKSTSHLVWRILPYHSQENGKITWHGKGDGEHDINLPFDVQFSLWTIEKQSDGIKKLAPEHDRVFGYEDLTEELGDKRTSDMRFSNKTKLRYQYIEPGFRSNYDVRQITQEMKPDFSKAGKKMSIDAPLYYGPVEVECIPSKDSTLEYLFFRDSYDRVWMTTPQIKNSKLSTYGVPSEYTAFGFEAESAAFEHTANPLSSYNFNFGFRNGSYTDVYTYMLKNMTLIQEYRRSRSIGDPVVKPKKQSKKR